MGVLLPCRNCRASMAVAPKGRPLCGVNTFTTTAGSVPEQRIDLCPRFSLSPKCPAPRAGANVPMKIDFIKPPPPSTRTTGRGRSPYRKNSAFAILKSRNHDTGGTSWPVSRRDPRYRQEAWARNNRIFGSVARGDQRENSDVDFLVDFEPGRSLLDLTGLWLDLSAVLGCKVDVISSRGLKPRLSVEVMRDAAPL